MAETLYNRDILRLASQLEFNPSFTDDLKDYIVGHAEMKSAICGSTASVKVALRDAMILEALIDIKSCAMGQASTALLIEYIHGKTYAEILEMRGKLKSILDGQNSDITSFPKLKLFEVAVGYNARHAAILLPYDSVLKAMKDEED